MSSTTAIHLMAFCLILLSGIFSIISVMAFANPTEFMRWLSPVHFFTRLILKENHARRFDRIISYSVAVASLFILMAFLFILGGYFTTAFFELWSSPFSRLLPP